MLFRSSARIGAATRQVIGIVEGDEALRVPRGEKDAAGVVDADGGVARRVKHHQRLPEAADGGFQAVRGDVLEELLLDAEGPSDQEHLRLARRLDQIGRASCRERVCQYV